MDRDDGRYALIETRLGACGLAWTAAGVVRFLLPARERSATEDRLAGRYRAAAAHDIPADIRGVIERVRLYGEGARDDFRDVALDLSGVGAFDAAVYGALRGVGWGETTTYGALARATGDPGRARAVGQAMGRNPIPLLVPCHRVLAAGERLGGFSAPGGTDTKRRMLALEGRLLAPPLLSLMERKD